MIHTKLKESGDIKFSTQDSIGRLGYPTYNQNTLEPSIENNLDANSAMYTEEYKKSQIYEDLIGDIEKDNKEFEVFVNPKSIKRMEANIRAIATENGDLFVLNDSFHIIHNELAKWLNVMGYNIPNNAHENLDTIIPLQRLDNTNNFYISESIYPDEIDKNINTIKEILNKTKEKNPTINFIIENILDVNEGRKKSYMPQSKAVRVKDKCRLGGLNGKSAACNQGDISNLEFSSINENNIPDELKKYAKQFSSDEELLRSGGFPIEILDRAAHGFSENDIKTLMPDQLKIKWKDDLENVKYEVENSGLSDIEYAKQIDLSEPIDVVYENGEFYVDDGHHRYFAAKTLKKPLNVNLEIKDNPIKKLANDFSYDDFHRNIWKLSRDLNEKVELNKGFQDGWNSYNILHNDDVAGIVELTIRDKYVTLNKIFINKEHRGMGHANDVLKILTDYADKNNKILTLTPDNIWGASKEKLKKWYKKWGFIMNTGINKDFKTRELMYRLPKGNLTKEGIGDKYLEKKYGIEPEFTKFDDQYRSYKNIEDKENVIQTKHGNIVKNPSSLNNIAPDVRGIIDREGNLYLEEEQKMLHNTILKELDRLGYVDYQQQWHINLPYKYITIRRVGDTNNFALGESNETMFLKKWRSSEDENIPLRKISKKYFQKFIELANKKHPKFNFINENYDYLDLPKETIDILDT